MSHSGPNELHSQSPRGTTLHLDLTVEEANVVLEALGDLPFRRVYGLISKIQEQAAPQLKPSRPVLADTGTD